VCARLTPGCGPDEQRAGITVVGTADAAAPLAEELSAQVGVRSATARLTGALELPALDTDVLLRLTTR
jgi:hypothetical protein